MASDVICADVLEWARTYDGPKFHAMLCDPPYHLTNRNDVAWQCQDCGRVLGARDGLPRDDCPRCGGHIERMSKTLREGGFMGKTWDGGDIAFRPETWAALAEHLHPGAFIMAFGGSRTFHRMACAIEDAGLIIHPAICWLYGSGFPKATRIDTQIDKAAGAEREVVGVEDGRNSYDGGNRQSVVSSDGTGYGSIKERKHNIVAPATPLAATWAGHRYGLQCLKPALEPIAIARKPLTDCGECDKLAQEVQTLMEGFLCQFISATDAERILSEVVPVQSAAIASSARLIATLIACALSQLPEDAQTVMWPWSVEASMILSIASLWSDIWAASSGQMSTSTISTATEAITVLKILRSFLLANTPDSIIQAVWPQSGQPCDVQAVGKSLSSSSLFLQSTRAPIAQGSVSRPAASNIKGSDANNADANMNPWASAKAPSAVTVLLSAIRRAEKSPEALTSLAKSAAELFANLRGQFATSSITAAKNATAELAPIVVAQKPYVGKPVECITRTGAGALNIEQARIGTGDVVRRANNVTIGGGGIYQGGGACETGAMPGQGRWPANLILSHTSECVKVGTRRVRCNGAFPKTIHGASPITFRGDEQREQRIELADADGMETVESWQCAPGCPVAALDAQSGERRSPNGVTERSWGALKTMGESNYRPCHDSDRTRVTNNGYGDTGGASRFFARVDYALEQADPFFYTAKASRRERDAGLEEYALRDGDECYGDGLGNGPDRILRRCHHPTVKPLALARYLATLLLPPAEYAPRRILIPFAGVASEMIGAGLAGWEEIVGIEQDAEYCEIGRARLAHWLRQGVLL